MEDKRTAHNLVVEPNRRTAPIELEIPAILLLTVRTYGLIVIFEGKLFW
jgi:hypothetical protein